MAQVPPEQAYFVRTDAICIDPKIGDLLGEYLFDALDSNLRETFKHHLDECTACFVAVTNWNNLGTCKGE